MKTITVSFVLALALITQAIAAADDYLPSPENLKAREWYRDAAFGMFIHWGPYAVLSDGEWVMNIKNIKKNDYEKLGDFFNPIDYNPAEWVALAKQAGMKYIVITSKHHDGFAMFDSKLTDWDIVDRTPYGKDVLKMLAEECRKQDIALFFYFSQLDWNHEDYYPRGRTGRDLGRPEEGEWYSYLDYMDGQLTELLTNYGDIAGIWFDGWWDKKDADWRLRQTYDLIHELQPQCLIGNNHHEAPKPGEDFQMFEKDLPGHNTSGYSEDSVVGSLPLETCETMNHSWGFNLRDDNHKSPEELIHYLVKASGYNANFLLNVGPMPNGEIQPEAVERLKAVGEWTDAYGETIYGTRAGPIPPRDWGVTTQKDGTVFVHILNWHDTAFLLPKFDGEIESISLFHNKKALHYNVSDLGTVINLPSEALELTDAVLEVKLKR